MIRPSLRTLAPLATLALAAVSMASPMKYTVSGFGTGSLNGSSFTQAFFKIETFGDTANITDDGLGDFALISDSNLITVSGVGSDALTGQIENIVNQVDGIAGVSSVTANFLILGAEDPAFTPYDLSTPTGPTNGLAEFNHSQSFATVGGSFVIDRMTDATFTAEAVPEPATLAALGLGLAAAFRRRKRA